MVIYVITNLESGKRYVGRTTRSAQRRWDDHLSACFTKMLSMRLYDDMRALGRERFDFTILEHVDTYEALMEREIAWIEILGTMRPNGYNIVRGGTSNLGWNPSPVTRERMSAWQRGRKLSDETRAKITASLKGNTRTLGYRSGKCWNKGLKATPEHRAHLSASAKGRKPGARNRQPHDQAYRDAASERRTQWWASLSSEQRQAHVEKIRQGHLEGEE